MHKNAMKCNETVGKWCINKHGASKNYRYVGDISKVARPRKTYRRRREDLGDIGDKNNKKVE
jgi:hypothetical protein